MEEHRISTGKTAVAVAAGGVVLYGVLLGVAVVAILLSL